MSKEQGEAAIAKLLNSCNSLETTRKLQSIPQTNSNVREVVSKIISRGPVAGAEAEYQKGISLLEAAIGAKKNEIESHISQWSTNQAILADKIKELAEVTAEYNKYKQEMETNKAEAQSLGAKIPETQAQISLLEKELQNKIQEKKSLLGHMTPEQVSFVLQKAMEDRNDEVIDALKDKPLDPHFVNSSQRSLLHTATDQHYTKVVEILLKQGASPDVVNESDGCTPWKVANIYHYDDIVKLMTAYHIFDDASTEQ